MVWSSGMDSYGRRRVCYSYNDRMLIVPIKLQKARKLVIRCECSGWILLSLSQAAQGNASILLFSANIGIGPKTCRRWSQVDQLLSTVAISCLRQESRGATISARQLVNVLARDQYQPSIVSKVPRRPSVHLKIASVLTVDSAQETDGEERFVGANNTPGEWINSL